MCFGFYLQNNADIFVSIFYVTKNMFDSSTQLLYISLYSFFFFLFNVIHIIHIRLAVGISVGSGSVKKAERRCSTALCGGKFKYVTVEMNISEHTHLH